MLIEATAEAMLPALSTAVPAATWFAPSEFRVAGAGQVAIPERRSAQLKVTVTAALFQPKVFGAGAGLAEIVGLVLSRLMVTEAEAVLPARSTAVPRMIWLAPSVLTVAGAEQDARPEVLSEQVNVTTTLVLFQPKVSAT